MQKLVELIPAKSTLPELSEFSQKFAKNLGKKVVRSNDIAGFIGNGHFMRDALYGLNKVTEITEEFTFPTAVYMINKITQDFLIRPMGIFQLIDYVGIDVCQFIMKVMNPHFPQEDLHSDLLDEMMRGNIKGGQNSDGSQKEGFFTYDKGRITGIYDPEKGAYTPVSEIEASADETLGDLPENHQPWKLVLRSSDRKSFLETYFSNLRKLNTRGAKIALDYGSNSEKIARKLVTDRVAANENEVNTVLLTGFFHAYGPVNNYFNREEN